jgi:AraC family transcriptional regulator of adaptative response / DNA-3-methyladenine glycosylase II
MLLDRESCDRAVDSADARFDGVFFVGVTTTAIYCRPICPARRALRKNRRYFTSAAAAERAGFRPCLRCRPELAPGRARVDAVPRLAQAAARRIAAGALNGVSLDCLASELGVSGRQLRRAMRLELGVSPVELAQTHRLLLAKQLLTDTRLSMSRVADASGFQSVRRFNALFRERYRLTPEALRRSVNGNGNHRLAASAEPGSNLTLTLAYRPPLAWGALLSFLGSRATPGAERVSSGTWARAVRIGTHTGVLRIRPAPAGRHVATLDADASLAPVLMTLCDRVRHVFDLNAEPNAIDSHLRRHGLATVKRGLRVPGAWDGFELAVRAILGQQVSVGGATTLMGRLTATFGEPFPDNQDGFTHLAPTAERLAEAGAARIRKIGLPLARAATIHEVAGLVSSGELSFGPDADVRRFMRQLLDIRGIGPWTAEYIAMRALHWPDAFPASDLVLRRAAGDLTTAELTRRAEAWRPWRSYAAMQLWKAAGTQNGNRSNSELLNSAIN